MGILMFVFKIFAIYWSCASYGYLTVLLIMFFLIPARFYNFYHFSKLFDRNLLSFVCCFYHTNFYEKWPIWMNICISKNFHLFFFKFVSLKFPFFLDKDSFIFLYSFYYLKHSASFFLCVRRWTMTRESFNRDMLFLNRHWGLETLN